MESFIEDYLATVTRNPRAAFAMLTPAFQQASGGLSGYQSFWNTIASAEPTSVSADPGSLTVDYTVDYTREDGSTGEFTVLARVDGPTELRYIHNGGILPAVLRRLYKESAAS